MDVPAAYPNLKPKPSYATEAPQREMTLTESANLLAQSAVELADAGQAFISARNRLTEATSNWQSTLEGFQRNRDRQGV